MRRLVLKREECATSVGGASAQIAQTTTPSVIAVPADAEDLVVGRSPVLSAARRLSIDATALSRTHARLAHNDQGALVIEDLTSTNGVFVNDQRLAKAKAVLKVGDVVTFGKTDPRLCASLCFLDTTHATRLD